MNDDELRYSRVRILMVMSLTLIFVMLGYWLAVYGYVDESSANNRRTLIAESLGPTGKMLLGYFVLILAAFAFAAFTRLLIVMPPAAYFDENGVRVNGLIKTLAIERSELVSIEVKAIGRQATLLVKSKDGKLVGVQSNIVQGGKAALIHWAERLEAAD